MTFKGRPRERTQRGRFAKMDPEVASERMRASGLEPLTPFPGYNKPWPCRCHVCSKDMSLHYDSVHKGRGKCVFCSGFKIHPEDAVAFMISKGVKPLTPYVTANKQWPCVCLTCRKNVQPSYTKMRRGGRGCAYCSGARVDPSEAVVAIRAVNLEPLVDYPGSMVPWLCRCNTCSREVTPTYNHIQQGKRGCKWCQSFGRTNDPDDAAQIMRTAGVEPLVPYPGASVPWRSRCLRCEKIVTPCYHEVRRGQGGCRWCAKRSPVAADDAVSLIRKSGLEPLVEYPGSMTPWLCRCIKCGKKVSPRYNKVQQRGGGCRWCATKGIDWATPGFVYLVTNETLDSHKVGIRNVDKRRIEEHTNRGWMLYAERYFGMTDEAFRVEQAIIRWWRSELHLPPHLSREEMPQNGYTETVSADAISLPDVWAKVLELSAALRAAPEPIAPFAGAPEQLGYPLIEDEAAA